MNAYSLIYVQQILPARIHLVCFRVIVTLVLDILDQFVLVINLNLTIIGWFSSFWQKMPSQGFSYLSKTKAVMREDNTKRDVDNSRYCVKTESYNCIYIYIYIYIYYTRKISQLVNKMCLQQAYSMSVNTLWHCCYCLSNCSIQACYRQPCSNLLPYVHAISDLLGQLVTGLIKLSRC